LSIHLLLHHFLFNVASLVDELLLTLDGRAVVVELGIFLSQGVVLSLKFHVLAPSHLIVSFLLALTLEKLKSLEHFLTDLLRRFQVVVKFLLVDAIFSCQELSKSSLSLFEIDCLAASHVFNTVTNDVLLDHFTGLAFPVRFVGQVLVSSDVIHHGGVFL